MAGDGPKGSIDIIRRRGTMVDVEQEGGRDEPGAM